MVEVEIKTVKCSVCGSVDEGLEITKRILGIFKIKVCLCEGCVSRYFRKFHRGK